MPGRPPTERVTTSVSAEPSPRWSRGGPVAHDDGLERKAPAVGFAAQAVLVGANQDEVVVDDPEEVAERARLVGLPDAKVANETPERRAPTASATAGFGRLGGGGRRRSRERRRGWPRRTRAPASGSPCEHLVSGDVALATITPTGRLRARAAWIQSWWRCRNRSREPMRIPAIAASTSTIQIGPFASPNT